MFNNNFVPNMMNNNNIIPNMMNNNNFIPNMNNMNNNNFYQNFYGGKTVIFEIKEPNENIRYI